MAIDRPDRSRPTTPPARAPRHAGSADRVKSTRAEVLAPLLRFEPRLRRLLRWRVLRECPQTRVRPHWSYGGRVGAWQPVVARVHCRGRGGRMSQTNKRPGANAAA